MLDKYLKPFTLRVLRPLANMFIRLGFRPDWLTLIGLGFSIGAAIVFASGHLAWGAVVMMFAGLCDILDGQVAREGSRETKFGGLLDSTTDRYAEIFLYFGIGYYLISKDHWIPVGVLFFAITSKPDVSLSIL
mgnify:CR=1 FL=1